MKVQELRVDFLLGGCRSLKEKRQRLRGLRDRFGKQPNLAVVESAFADSVQRSRWSFLGAASSLDPVLQQLSDIERYLSLTVDAEILSMQRIEWYGADESSLPAHW